MICKFCIIFATITYCLVELTESANILVITPMGSPSHFKSFQPLWETLIERKHNLTIIAGYELNKNFQSKYTLVNIKSLFKKINLVFAELRLLNQIQALRCYDDAFQRHAEEVLKCSAVQAVINSNNEYDLVIAEMFHFDAFLAFGYKFNAPVIAVNTLPQHNFYNWILGNSFPASYYPDILLPFTEKMSLPARIVNMAYNFFAVLFYELVALPKSQTQIEKYFNFNVENVPNVKDIINNISVILVNSHHSFGYVKPDLPNIVNVAGIHLTAATILPQNMQKFMDEAEHGVIYLSLGSAIETDKLESLGKIFIGIMKNLPQRIIMKWDANLLPYVPKNFLVQEWIPQEAVLNYSKCRLFITHGGLHSSLESLNAAVPLIGIPFFADQQYNMRKVEYFQIGVAVNVDDISNELPLKINEVLNNPKYKENIVKRSQLFRERLNTPLETALYWVDHVLKHKDTSHLRSASSQLTWYELYSVDVFIVIAAIFLVAIKVVEFSIRRIIQKLAYLKNVSFPKAKTWQDEKLKNNLKCD